jgi:hypothetical protein
VCSALLFLFDTLDRLWRPLIATGEVTMEARAHIRLAASHAVTSAVQAIGLIYNGAGASALYTSCSVGTGIPGCACNNAAHWG